MQNMLPLKQILAGVILYTLAGIFSGVAHAQSGYVNQYYADKYRGWFFREPIPEPEQEEPVKKQAVKPTAPPAKTEPKPFSRKWLQTNLQDLMDAAIENPTPENIEKYMVVQKLATHQASNFSTAAMEVVQRNPWLSGENGRGVSAVSQRYLDARSAQSKKVVAQQLTESVGLWFFFSGSCSSCHALAPVMRLLKDEYGFKILPISLDGKGLPDFPAFQKDQGQAAKFGIKSTPTVLVFKDGQFLPLLEGLASADQMLDRMIFMAKENKWITEKQYHDTFPVNQSAYASPEFINSLTAEDISNGRVLSEKMRQSIENQMRAVK